MKILGGQRCPPKPPRGRRCFVDSVGKKSYIFNRMILLMLEVDIVDSVIEVQSDRDLDQVVEVDEDFDSIIESESENGSKSKSKVCLLYTSRCV